MFIERWIEKDRQAPSEPRAIIIPSRHLWSLKPFNTWFSYKHGVPNGVKTLCTQFLPTIVASVCTGFPVNFVLVHTNKICEVANGKTRVQMAIPGTFEDVFY